MQKACSCQALPRIGALGTELEIDLAGKISARLCIVKSHGCLKLGLLFIFIIKQNLKKTRMGDVGCNALGLSVSSCFWKYPPPQLKLEAKFCIFSVCPWTKAVIPLLHQLDNPVYLFSPNSPCPVLCPARFVVNHGDCGICCAVLVHFVRRHPDSSSLTLSLEWCFCSYTGWEKPEWGSQPQRPYSGRRRVLCGRGIFFWGPLQSLLWSTSLGLTHSLGTSAPKASLLQHIWRNCTLEETWQLLCSSSFFSSKMLPI